jgi:hypothetical protein
VRTSCSSAEVLRLPSCLPPGVLALDIVLGTVTEEFVQGREDPLLPIGRFGASATLPDLWASLINSQHSSYGMGIAAATALHAAVLCGTPALEPRLKAYVDAGADVDAPSGADSTTPLMAALLSGQTSVASFLLSRGANVDALDGVSQPVLKYALGSVGRTPVWNHAGIASTLCVRDDQHANACVNSAIKLLLMHGE